MTGCFLVRSKRLLQFVRRWKWQRVQTDMAHNFFSLPIEYPRPMAHVMLPPEFVAGKQVFVIGDVHGCHDELQLLLDKVGIGAGTPNVITILVGDLINKGPKNREVLNLVRKLGAYSVRGNHDQKILHQMTLLRMGRPIEDRFNWIRSLTEEDFQHLNGLPYTISLPSLQSVIVHACLVPGIPLALQDGEEMMTSRNLIQLDPDAQTASASHQYLRPPRYKATKFPSQGQPWASLWPGPEHVYFGHDALKGLQLYNYATGLDTGCVYGRRLTGVFLREPKQLVHIEAKNVHCQPDYPL